MVAGLVGAAVLSGCQARGGDDHRGPAAAPDVALVGHRDSAGTGSWTPWPQAMHDAQHSGASQTTGPREGRIRWARSLEGDVTPGPVVTAAGLIVVASNAGVLHALDPVTGRDRWTVDGGASYGNDLSTSAAVLPSGLILWPGPRGLLFGVSPEGHVLWRQESPTGAQLTSPSVTDEGEVVVGDIGGGLMALRPTERVAGVRWSVDLEESSYGSAVWSADGRTAYQSVTSHVVAVRDGDVVWRSDPLTELIEVSPAVAPDGTVVIGTNDPWQYGLDPDDGSVRWRHPRPAWTYSSPVVTGDGVSYFGDHLNRITGLDATDGRVLFSFQGSTKDVNPGGIGVWTSVLVDAEHTVYAGTRQGLVYAVDRDAHLLWQLELGATVDSYPALRPTVPS